MWSTSDSRHQDLVGKVAVITGASRGIGLATALNLYSRGCSILGTCSDEKNLSLFGDIRFYARMWAVVANIFDPNCAQIIADTLKERYAGQVDIFVNNAADARPGVIGELTVEEIQQSLVANIQTPVLIIEELVKRKYFRPESRIIYISSVRSRQPWSMQLMYAAGKSAGESLCRTWAEAFGGKEERVSEYVN